MNTFMFPPGLCMFELCSINFVQLYQSSSLPSMAQSSNHKVRLALILFCTGTRKDKRVLVLGSLFILVLV